MKTIVVPVDFSEESHDGIAMAMELARKFDAEIELVYVQPAQQAFGHVALEAEKKAAEEEFSKIADQLRSKNPKLKVSWIVKRGKVYREIIGQAEASEDSVIVTSTHGASGFEELFVGSNTLKILANTQVPVYTIRHGVKPTAIKNIVFPMDTTLESRQKSGYTAKLAEAYGAKVHVLGLLESPSESLRQRLSAYIEQVRSFFEGRGIEVVISTLEDVDLVDGSIAYAQKLEGALITVSSMNRKSLPLLLIGGNSQRLLSRSNVPVLCLAATVEPVGGGSFRTNG